MINKHTELRVFAMMAENLRPNLANCLKAAFKPADGIYKQYDMAPFAITMKRVAFILYSTLFVTVLSPSNLYRI
jgi:hypothetical protein